MSAQTIKADKKRIIDAKETGLVMSGHGVNDQFRRNETTWIGNSVDTGCYLLSHTLNRSEAVVITNT